MLDIIIFCAIAGFFCYKLYVNLGKYDENDQKISKKQSEAKTLFSIKKEIEKSDTKAIELKSNDSNKKIENNSEIHENVINIINSIAETNLQLLKSIPEAKTKDFNSFFQKYPSFNINYLLSFTKEFFEEFFQSYYSQNLIKIKSFISQDIFDSLSKKSILHKSNDIVNNIKTTNLLYKIEDATVTDFTYNLEKQYVLFSIKITALQLSFTEDAGKNIVSGSKKTPNRFYSTLEFKKILTQKETKDPSNTSDYWMLNSIA